MTTFDAFLNSLGSPLDILVGFDRQAARAAGVKPATINDWDTLHRVYFGPTRFTRKQAQAVRAARETDKSLDQLVLIENQLKAVSDPSEKWRLRRALLSVRGNYDTLKRRAKDIIPDPDLDKPAPESTVRFSKTRKGTRSFTATGHERDIAALEYALRQGLDPRRPAGPQMYEALTGILKGDGGVADAVPRPLVVVPLDEHTKILAGQGDETVVGLSDGTTMTGAEYLARFCGEDLEVALFHPQAGPVNLYTGHRFANQKQRDLARATLTTCPVPECRHAADNCEVHHVTPWARGGPTNMDNLSILCRYHNRTNDDDPAHQHRGRIQIRGGTPVWVSPRGTPVANTTHQYGAMHLLFGKQQE
ncbi:HNH endonuclease signature motif containing protein [Corynebacterium sp. P3-F1]|uniref:HNH endonuclease signature motif containing protein n=1 Tax=Corynebacterium sp. P3-F1 TaxID=3059080 RepID=UPI00265D34B8|nr:HNH endonuclease signature motif containing protein [Corynebacterium sp. P3-F1]WKK61299.1 HNH endonuclease signature motif containing protein [Corynebacterium sp. P3-F1]